MNRRTLFLLSRPCSSSVEARVQVPAQVRKSGAWERLVLAWVPFRQLEPPAVPLLAPERHGSAQERRTVLRTANMKPTRRNLGRGAGVRTSQSPGASYAPSVSPELKETVPLAPGTKNRDGAFWCPEVTIFRAVDIGFLFTVKVLTSDSRRPMENCGEHMIAPVLSWPSRVFARAHS